MRLDRFLADYVGGLEEADADAALTSLSRTRIKGLIEEGDVLLDGRRTRAAAKLQGGEWATLRVPDPEPLPLWPEPMDLDIIFEDSDLIAVNKAAGFVVHPGAGAPAATLVHGLLAHCSDLSGIGGKSRPGIVHRLDRDTSGVMVVAKNDHAHQGLARQFAERTADKCYVAFVLGEPVTPRATIDTPYGRKPSDRKRFTGRIRSQRRALTSYQVVRAGGGLAHLAVQLGTGRTHQIRVHLSEHGHPVAGDRAYGGTRLSRLKNPVSREHVAALERQALHAARLEITHPRQGRPLVLEAPLPADLAALEAAIRALAGP